MPTTAPPSKKVPFLRRWQVPIALSLIANLLAFGIAGNWFGTRDINVPTYISLRHIQLVQPPQVAPKPERKPVQPQPKLQPRDNRPQQPKSQTHSDAATARAGAQRAPVHTALLPQVTPRSVAPQNQEKDVDRDPFQPDVAPAAIIPQPTHAQKTVALPTPPVVSPPVKPTQIAPVTGIGQPAARQPSPTPTPTATLHPASGAAGIPGPVRVGSGGQGQGERGSGIGAGGVIPFGVGGGRGGEGDHYILYLLDFSPSMVSRMPDLFHALQDSMSNLTQDDLFDIFAFGSQVIKMEDYLEPATPDSLAEAHTFLRSMHTIDGTNIEEVMIEALNLHHVNEIVLITDGVPNQGETDFGQLENEIRLMNTRHVPITTIGLVGVNDYNRAEDTFQGAELLRTIARQSGGNYKEVPLGIDSPE